MKRLIAFIILINTTMACTNKNTSIQEKIIGLEKAALERWYRGDPTGVLELSATDVVYFDPFIEKRINGLETLTNLYEPIKGQIKVDRYELIAPLVQTTNGMAVLTYNLKAYDDADKIHKWNCTEVFRLEPDGSWKIIQTHWSLTQPVLKEDI